MFAQTKTKRLSACDLYDYQRKAAGLIVKHHKVSLWLKPGMGKTVSTLFAISHLDPVRTLIVAPKRVCATVWEQEAQSWEGLDHLTFTNLNSTPRKRLKLLLQPTDFHMISYDLLSWLSNTIEISEAYDAIIYDEVSLLKSPSSNRFKAVRDVGGKVPIVVGLTGTPTGNNLLGVWSQIHATTGPSNPLGRTHTEFKSRYFRAITRTYSTTFTDYKPYTWTKDKMIEDAGASVFSFKLEKEYCPLKFVSLPVGLPDKVKGVYREIAEAYMIYTETGKVAQAASAASLRNKLRQIEAGAIYVTDAQNPGATGEYSELHDHKIKAVADLVEELNGDPLLIFYGFKFEKVWLEKLFPGCTDVSAEQWNTGSVPVLAAHPANYGYGVNLQKGGCNILYLTAPDSLELFEQSKGRLYRTGQSRTVTIYKFDQMPVEKRVWRALQNNQDVEDYMMRGLTV